MALSTDVLFAEGRYVKYVVVCPECHVEHLEPPEAHVGLFVVCADCVLAIEVHVERLRPLVLEPAA